MADEASPPTQGNPAISPGDHGAYMRLALSLATQSPPKPTNYRVGAVVVDVEANEVLATGYTLELPGNTHAEQCCFEKLSRRHGDLPLDRLGPALPPRLALYTTVEPCSRRLSGNLPCVERVLALAPSPVATVYVGVKEPETFVSGNWGLGKLHSAGVEVVHVTGLEDEILKVATAGHKTG